MLFNCANAQSEKLAKSICFNAGLHTEFFNAVQTDTTGSQRKFTAGPTIGLGALIPTPIKLLFLPELNWVLPNPFNSEHVIKNTFFLRGDIAYDFFERLRLRLGMSIAHLNQQGRGGKARISNGNSTSTFYYPDENRSSLNNTLDLGIEGLINAKWSVRFQTYTYAILSKDRRQLSYTIFVSYYWDQ